MALRVKAEFPENSFAGNEIWNLMPKFQISLMSFQVIASSPQERDLLQKCATKNQKLLNPYNL